MTHIREAVDNAIIDLIKRFYEGRAPIHQKIAVLIVTRRENHGNDKIQDECSKYLELLYDEKYKMLEKQNEFRICKRDVE